VDQNLANKLAKEFTEITDVKCKATFMDKGLAHIPTTQGENEKGVYVFLLNSAVCFKVGKAGCNSSARWNSHHYSLDKTTPSTLTKSILSNIDNFKSLFSCPTKKKEIDNFETIIRRYIVPPNKFREGLKKLSKDEVKRMRKDLKLNQWVKDNICRVEFIISGDENDFTLGLLEAYMQFKLKPVYEGKNAQ
jgi:hypothetical protein